MNLKIECPCCHELLEVDSLSGKILSRKKPSQKAPGDRFKEALEKLKTEKEKREKYFSGAKQGMEEQKKKAKEWFEKEKERIEKEGDDTPPPRPFDWD